MFTVLILILLVLLYIAFVLSRLNSNFVKAAYDVSKDNDEKIVLLRAIKARVE